MKTKLTQLSGWAAVAVCLAYAVAGVAWWRGAAGYPFGQGDPEMVGAGEDAIAGSLLGYSTADIGGPAITVLGVFGAVIVTMMLLGRGPRRLLVVSGAVLAIGLCLVIQDYRPLLIVAYTPIFLLAKPFGAFGELSFADVYLWPRVSLLLLLVVGILIAVVTSRYRQVGIEPAVARDRDQLLRIGRIAVVVAVVSPLVYCVTRWLWALGFSLGFPAEEYAEGLEAGLWLAGAGLATLGALGALLTVGLVQRWGEVFPRWMIGLAGRRVPPRLATVPATFVSVLITAAGLMPVRIVLFRGIEPYEYAAILPELLWPAWGVGLFVATWAYAARRRIYGDRDGAPAVHTV